MLELGSFMDPSNGIQKFPCNSKLEPWKFDNNTATIGARLYPTSRSTLMMVHTYWWGSWRRRHPDGVGEQSLQCTNMILNSQPSWRDPLSSIPHFLIAHAAWGCVYPVIKLTVLALLHRVSALTFKDLHAQHVFSRHLLVPCFRWCFE